MEDNKKTINPEKEENTAEGNTASEQAGEAAEETAIEETAVEAAEEIAKEEPAEDAVAEETAEETAEEEPAEDTTGSDQTKELAEEEAAAEIIVEFSLEESPVDIAATEEKVVKKKPIKKILQGRVISNKPDKTIIVNVVRKVAHPLYKKYYNQSKKFMAHDENNECNTGDSVRIKECRPLSARKRWELLDILERAK